MAADLIHMNTETVLATVDKLKVISANIHDAFTAVDKTVRNIKWEGPSRDDFVYDVGKLLRFSDHYYEESLSILFRVQKEVEEWIEVDNHHAEEFRSIGGVINTIIVFIKKDWDEFQRQETYKNNREAFRDWWKELSEEEKKVFLQKMLERIAKKLGIPVIDLSFPDLDDTKGDWRGSYTDDNRMELDITNVLESDPYELINTLAHESEHKYQMDCLNAYKATGAIPEGMTQADMEVWKSNFDHYIDGNNDFELYWNQVIEIDARDTGAGVADEFIMDSGWKG